MTDKLAKNLIKCVTDNKFLGSACLLNANSKLGQRHASAVEVAVPSASTDAVKQEQ